MYQTVKNLKAQPSTEHIENLSIILIELAGHRNTAISIYSSHHSGLLTTFESLLIDFQVIIRACRKNLDDIYLYDVNLLLAKLELLQSGIIVKGSCPALDFIKSINHSVCLLGSIKEQLFEIVERSE